MLSKFFRVTRLLFVFLFQINLKKKKQPFKWVADFNFAVGNELIEISGFHEDEYEDGCLLGCCAVLSDR
jgi:hypothetical protein